MTFIMLKTSKTIKKDALGFMTEYTGSLAGDISTFFSDKIGYISGFSSMPDVRDFRWNAVKDPFFALAKENGTFSSFILAHADGSYYRSDETGNPAQGGLITANNADPKAAPVSITTRDYFKQLITNNADNKKMVFISDPNVSKTTGIKQVVIATNIRDKNGKTDGLLGITVSGKRLELELDEIMKQTQDIVGTGATIALISDTGAVVSVRSYDKGQNAYKETALNKPETFGLEVFNPSFRAGSAEPHRVDRRDEGIPRRSGRHADTEKRPRHELQCRPQHPRSHALFRHL